jgi:polyisoprenoid-binding protein YceI
MKFRTSLLAFAALLFAALPALAQSYTIDPAHSEINFSIKHMAIATVRGRFSLQTGTIVLDEKNPASSSVTAVIDVASVDTGVAQRDGHLKSPDFFDTAKFPTATFTSHEVKRAGAGFDVIGTLTLHGVSKPVTLHMDAPSKEQIGMDGKPHRGFSATTTLHRQDFGLNWNGPLKSGDNMLGDDVPMTFDIEAIKVQ